MNQFYGLMCYLKQNIEEIVVFLYCNYEYVTSGTVSSIDKNIEGQLFTNYMSM